MEKVHTSNVQPALKMCPGQQCGGVKPGFAGDLSHSFLVASLHRLTPQEHRRTVSSPQPMAHPLPKCPYFGTAPWFGTFLSLVAFLLHKLSARRSQTPPYLCWAGLGSLEPSGPCRNRPQLSSLQALSRSLQPCTRAGDSLPWHPSWGRPSEGLTHRENCPRHPPWLRREWLCLAWGQHLVLM